jgi:hypothetical protein
MEHWKSCPPAGQTPTALRDLSDYQMLPTAFFDYSIVEVESDNYDQLSSTTILRGGIFDLSSVQRYAMKCLDY